MKRLIITAFLCFTGMTIFAQNMSSLLEDFTKTDSSFQERLTILETVKDIGASGAGEFYHEALKFFLLKFPDIRTLEEFSAAEKTARILCTSLGEEKVTASALELWGVVEYFDVARPRFDNGKNEGLVMQDALVALGKVNGNDFTQHIVERLSRFNTLTYTDVESKRTAQRGVIGCVDALEALRDPSGYRPVFFVFSGSYDREIQQRAYKALPNILDDPCDVFSEIIADSSTNPSVKLLAWNEMLKTNAPGSSKAKTAAVALATTFTYNTSDRRFQTNLKDLRKGAINTIREHGVSDDSVYENLEKTYNASYNTNSPDYDEIQMTLDALRTVKSEEAVELLLKFLQQLHERRRSGPWSNRENRVFERVVAAIGATGTQNVDVRLLLTTIQRTSGYTSAQQRMATNALSALGYR